MSHRWFPIKYEKIKSKYVLYTFIRFVSKGRFFQKVWCIFQIAQKMCQKEYPEQEILINIAILLGIPINGNVYLLAFMGIPYIQKLQRI